MKCLITIIMAALLINAAFCAVGCTKNARARKFGGTSTEQLVSGRKLVNATWKDTDLWILTRPMRKDEVAETYEFKEFSSMGMIEGRVIITERR